MASGAAGEEALKDPNGRTGGGGGGAAGRIRVNTIGAALEALGILSPDSSTQGVSFGELKQASGQH